jgi:hypothetical protein
MFRDVRIQVMLDLSLNDFRFFLVDGEEEVGYFTAFLPAFQAARAMTGSSQITVEHCEPE